MSKSTGTCRYLYLKMLVYGSWNCINVFFVNVYLVSFSSIFYMLWTIKVWSGTFFRGLITNVEFKNPSSASISQVATMWNGKQTCVRFNFLYLFLIFFLLKLDLLWNHFVTQNVMTNIVLPNHPPKTSDWRFAWQNGYGRHP